MERAWQACVLAALALAVLAWPVPRIAELSGRPRFVVALVLAAIALGVYEAWSALAPHTMPVERLWLGYRATGQAARGIALSNAAVCAVAALGLWRMRRWARLLGMGYLGYLIGSFLIWGLRGSAREDLVSIMLWQMLVLPFLTFALMYLQRGARYFH